ncbi:MAG: hypothetical protein LBI03_08690 [Clostridiales bacterium]|nr:hypothetical protein [Clostridiales bacterium]
MNKALAMTNIPMAASLDIPSTPICGKLILDRLDSPNGKYFVKLDGAIQKRFAAMRTI